MLYFTDTLYLAPAFVGMKAEPGKSGFRLMNGWNGSVLGLYSPQPPSL